jgi:acyl dehydratase
MPLESSFVGTTAGPTVTEIDARWAMAYAAGLGDTLPCYMDTRRRDGIVTHPLFPVCFEYPAMLEFQRKLHGSKLTKDEAVRMVHATHDLIIYRLARPPESLTTRLTIAGIERCKPGAFQLLRIDTAGGDGTPVCTTWMGAIYREVDVVGPDRAAADAPEPLASSKSAAAPRTEIRMPVSAVAAHVYTECARIWNPIHTDTATAEKAGLPGIVLHGTATLAMAVSRVVEAEAGSDPERVARVAGRFGAMVLMPSELVVRILAREKTHTGDNVFFEVLTADGGRAIRDGVVVLRT